MDVLIYIGQHKFSWFMYPIGEEFNTLENYVLQKKINQSIK